MNKTKGLKIAALIFPGIPLASLLLFAIGEPVGRNWSGLGHLIEAIPVALLMWVGWVADYNDPDNFLRKIFH